ncbi:MAG: J domain-containing protein [Solirubrobacterales bacterium]|nr:J domain-containing protein [Solirubrobacterales bacterium]
MASRAGTRCTPTGAGQPGAPAAPGRDRGSRHVLSRDPYTVLGVRPGVSEEELRAAYRRLVQLHHPDHNNGSAEAARRFEEVQEAYSAITRERRRSPARPRSEQPPPASPDVEQRLAEMERDLREKARAARETARAARARAQRAARRATTSNKRASDEELGYVKTDDSFGKILADGLDDVAEWLQKRRRDGDSD